MATHSSILAWRIPMDKEAWWLQSIGSQRVKHKWGTNTLTFSFIVELIIVNCYQHLYVYKPISLSDLLRKHFIKYLPTQTCFSFVLTIPDNQQYSYTNTMERGKDPFFFFFNKCIEIFSTLYQIVKIWWEYSRETLTCFLKFCFWITIVLTK